ncbi:hypothetical protein BH23GEM9_BH23GEM9_29210 [soil metagenome]
MSWLRRAGRPSPEPAAQPDEESLPDATEAAAPGVASLFEGVSEDRSHAVLDLGAATPSSLGVYSRFARQIRFADLTGQLDSQQGWRSAAEVLDAIPYQPGHPYDLIFAWDVLDRLLPEYHAPVVARLAEVTGPAARLHVVARAFEAATTQPLRFALLDTNRMRHEAAGAPVPTQPLLLPARIAQLLAPFRVVHGFTLKGGLREYVAIRKN